MAEQYDPIPETVADALAKWDAGESVFSVEMGGIGPGYEQCIQVLAFELMRAWKDHSWPEVDKKALEEIADGIVNDLNKRFGFSGAQVGAAKNLAANVCRRGYRAALRDPVVSERLIQVSKKFPD